MSSNPIKRRRRWEITDRMFFSLFLTGSLIEFSQVGAGFIDGLIISRYLGSDAMAAEGIVYPIFSILGIISGLLAVGMQTKCAEEIGRGDREKYLQFVSVTVYTGIIITLVVTALLLIFAKPFVVLFGASGNAAYLADSASKYLIGVVIGTPPLTMSVILAPALQLDTGHRYIQIAALLDTVANIVLDIVSVKMGWGLMGVGLSTAAASYLCFFCLCLFFLKKDRMLHFVRPNIPVKEFLKMLTYGSEKAVRRLSNVLRPMILNTVIISYGGAAAMSVLSVRNNFSNFAAIFGAGIASAVSLLAGVYFGENNVEGIKAVKQQEHRTNLIFVGGFSLLMLLFTKQLVRLYIPEDGEIYDLTVYAFRLLAVQLPLQALITSRISYLQAIQKIRNMQLLTFCTRFAFVVLSALVLGRLFSSRGILACFFVNDIISLFAIYVYYAVKCRRLCPTMQDFLNLPDHFYLHPGNVISLDIRSQEDVSLGSEQIMLFCKGHKSDSRTAYFAALSFEELASNIITYGFPKSRSSSPIIDLRCAFADHTLLIRLSDNCPKYDVTRQISALKEEDSDPLKNIGIRIVSKIASDITYLNTFKTNSLIIRFDLSSHENKV